MNCQKIRDGKHWKCDRCESLWIDSEWVPSVCLDRQGEQHRMRVLALAQSLYAWFDHPDDPHTFNGNPATLRITVEGDVNCLALAEAVLADIDARIKAQVS